METPREAPSTPPFSCPCGKEFVSAVALISHVQACETAQDDVRH